jgi:hypothetical protein
VRPAAEAKRGKPPFRGWMNDEPLSDTIRAALEAIKDAPAQRR